MSDIIKFSEASQKGVVGSVKVLVQAQHDDAGVVDEAQLALNTQAAEIEQLHKQLEQAGIEARNAIEEAKTEARKAAELAFDDVVEARLAVLKEGIVDAHLRLETQLLASEQLSIAVAIAALEKIFHPHDDYREIVGRMIASQMKQLRHDTILAVMVSPQDFSGNDHLDLLAEELTDTSLEIKTDTELAPGAVTIDLRIGQLEFSAKQCWEDLAVLLKDIAASEVKT